MVDGKKVSSKEIDGKPKKIEEYINKGITSLTPYFATLTLYRKPNQNSKDI